MLDIYVHVFHCLVTIFFVETLSNDFDFVYISKMKFVEKRASLYIKIAISHIQKEF